MTSQNVPMSKMTYPQMQPSELETAEYTFTNQIGTLFHFSHSLVQWLPTIESLLEGTRLVSATLSSYQQSLLSPKECLEKDTVQMLCMLYLKKRQMWSTGSYHSVVC